DAQRIVDTLRQNPWMGIKVRGWFSTTADRCALESVKPMGRVEGLAEYVEKHHIDQVWIALPMREQGQIAHVLRQLDHSTTDIKLLPDLFGLQLLTIRSSRSVDCRSSTFAPAPSMDPPI